jgi:tetratricopeptide (TPR) repeat protein
LEQVVARNPDYAPAWALLGFDYGTLAYQSVAGQLDDSRRIADAFVPKAQAAIRRAIQLDPNLPDGYERSSTMEGARGKLVAAEDLMLKALALDPDNPDVLHTYSLLLAKAGRLKEAMPIRLKLQSVEPFVPLYNARTSTLLWVNGQNDAALAMFKALPNLGFIGPRGTARIYATTGHYGEAADALQGISATAASPASVQEAVRLLRSGPVSVSSTDNPRSLDRWSWVYLYVGAPEQSLQIQERMVDLGLLAGDEAIEFWHPDYAPVRKTERFKAFARKAGLVDYWKSRGWPDLCHPTTGDDFECS